MLLSIGVGGEGKEPKVTCSNSWGTHLSARRLGCAEDVRLWDNSQPPLQSAHRAGRGLVPTAMAATVTRGAGQKGFLQEEALAWEVDARAWRGFQASDRGRRRGCRLKLGICTGSGGRRMWVLV